MWRRVVLFFYLGLLKDFRQYRDQLRQFSNDVSKKAPSATDLPSLRSKFTNTWVFLIELFDDSPRCPFLYWTKILNFGAVVIIVKQEKVTSNFANQEERQIESNCLIRNSAKFPLILITETLPYRSRKKLSISLSQLSLHKSYQK